MYGHTVEVVRNGEDGTLERRDGIPRARVVGLLPLAGMRSGSRTHDKEAATSTVGERLYGAHADGGATALACGGWQASWGPGDRSPAAAGAATRGATLDPRKDR